MLTQAELKLKLSYNPETGIFTWLLANIRRVKFGATAGTLNTSGYLVITINRKLHTAHRLAWFYVYGEWPKDYIDHIDGDKLNNRIANLRECNSSQNGFNSKIGKNNTSGYKGVSFRKNANKWVSSAKINGKSHHLGTFKTPEEASIAYEAFAAICHGEFYRETCSHP